VDLVYVEATPAQIAATLAGLSAQPDVFRTVSVAPEAEKEGPDADLQALVRQQVFADEGKQAPGAGGGGGTEQASPAKAPPRAANLAASAGEETLERSNATTINAATNFQSRAQRLPSQSVYNQNAQQNKPGAMLQGQRPASPAGPLEKSQSAAEPAESQERRLATDRLQTNLFGYQTPESLQGQRLNWPAERQRVLFVLRVAGGDQSGPLSSQIQTPNQSNAKPAASPAGQPADKPAGPK
jgi:hypothetical protein